MYKCTKKLMRLAFFVMIPTLLSACGGAPTEDTSDQPNNIANEPEVSSVKPTSSLASSLSNQAFSSTQSDLLAPNTRSSTASQSNADLGVTAPTPIQLQLYKLTETSITLIWGEVAGISHYEISRNGEVIARVDSPSHTLVDQGLAPYTNYNYTITAFDLTSKESAPSQTFALRTLAASVGATSKSPPSTLPDQSISSISTKSSASPKASSSSKSSVSSKSYSSSKSSVSSKAISSSKSSSSIGQQTVTISWNHPSQRENGDFLELDEIGGYQIRYRKSTDTVYTYITLNGNSTTEYKFSGEAQDLEFEIAVFDTAGLYSQFVKVTQ